MVAEVPRMRGFFAGSRVALIRRLGVSVVAVTIAGAMLAPAAIASPGSELWVKRYNGPASSFDGARAVAVSPDGSRVFVTGASDGSPDTANDYATIAYDAATGSRLWLARFNGSAADLNDAARAIAVSPDGSTVFVTGESYGAAGV
jgi:DNA-binding beta-propeller fold protein YncE